MSRRDFASTLAARAAGATTVAGTMMVADMAGIAVFVTGGIGGVHRGAETTWDVSADLTELGRTPVAVVCAGVKSILDIPKTLEYLETQGVPVLAYGTDEFPAFFTPHSGQRAPERVDTAKGERSQICFTSQSILVPRSATLLDSHRRRAFLQRPCPHQFSHLQTLLASLLRATDSVSATGLS